MIADKQMERCLASLAIRKRHIKTTPTGTITGNADKDVEQVNSHTPLVGMQNGSATLENGLAVSYKVKCALTI